jgi:hypothetical protein
MGIVGEGVTIYFCHTTANLIGLKQKVSKRYSIDRCHSIIP